MRSTSRISILAVLADRDMDDNTNLAIQLQFQSSRSLRTATVSGGGILSQKEHFNPRGPCGPRRSGASTKRSVGGFQSSRSLRTATAMTACSKLRIAISILAVLADRDGDTISAEILGTLFQSSRSLRTATLNLARTSTGSSIFQSSRSLRTATPGSHLPGRSGDISILAVLTDRDLARVC